jgi:hypothetical protein
VGVVLAEALDADFQGPFPMLSGSLSIIEIPKHVREVVETSGDSRMIRYELLLVNFECPFHQFPRFFESDKNSGICL